MTTLIRSVERRFPGAKVYVEPWNDPDGDPHYKWWISVPGWPRRRRDELHMFVIRRERELFPRGSAPFFYSTYGPWDLEGYRARVRAARGRGGQRVLGSSRRGVKPRSTRSRARASSH